ncbi:Hypothetical_protein [Hexamita inflata]|uniref:Hypothetical_protein n=1 Tax=Hexamita inflata TaxID=28002 RepID=A0AA86QVZ6_9EUKA|nr:Hypothetical protein HINF_LOCUS52813 [Hexamita inflata]
MLNIRTYLKYVTLPSKQLGSLVVADIESSFVGNVTAATSLRINGSISKDYFFFKIQETPIVIMKPNAPTNDSVTPRPIFQQMQLYLQSQDRFPFHSQQTGYSIQVGIMLRIIPATNKERQKMQTQVNKQQY